MTDADADCYSLVRDCIIECEGEYGYPINLIDRNYPYPDCFERTTTDRALYMERLAEIRNDLVGLAMDVDPWMWKYLFLCDADIEVDDMVLERLYRNCENYGKTVWAAQVKNGERGTYNYLWRDKDGSYVRLDRYPRPLRGITQVAMSGACWMIPREAIVRLLNDGPLFTPNMAGEEIGLCERLYDIGYKIYVDPMAETIHHMSEGRSYNSDEIIR
jgi:GT2 family glycosyltransferase